MPTDNKINILIADDHALLRKGLRAALSEEPDINVMGEASDGIEAAALAARLKPDVIIMDVYMPRVDGIHALVSIKTQMPKVKVLLLTVSDREEDLVKAMRFGADGYVLKKSRIEDVTEAVRRVSRGETVLSSFIAQGTMARLLDSPDASGLSEREKEVLELLGKGLTNTEIADRLGLSYSTVGSYVYRLLQKLHLKSRAEAISYSARSQKQTEPY